ncbi:MAG: hypothetical protein AB7N76_03415 [Planctomycetota bacterium]
MIWLFWLLIGLPFVGAALVRLLRRLLVRPGEPDRGTGIVVACSALLGGVEGGLLAWLLAIPLGSAKPGFLAFTRVSLQTSAGCAGFLLGAGIVLVPYYFLWLHTQRRMGEGHLLPAPSSESSPPGSEIH